MGGQGLLEFILPADSPEWRLMVFAISLVQGHRERAWASGLSFLICKVGRLEGGSRSMPCRLTVGRTHIKCSKYSLLSFFKNGTKN